MNPLNRLHEDKWFTPFVDQETTKLQKNETLEMVLAFEILHKEDEDKQSQSIFTVTRTEDKAIARTLVVHSDKFGFDEGKASNIAEYPLEDLKKLIKETREHALMMAAILQSKKEELDIMLNEKNPVMYIQAKEGMTNKEIGEKMLKEKKEVDQQWNIKEIIIRTLGLDEENTTVTKTGQDIQLTKVDNEAVKEKSNLKKAAEEMDLIKKYGKKNIERLAKQINYNGEIINKQKTNA